MAKERGLLVDQLGAFVITGAASIFLFAGLYGPTAQAVSSYIIAILLVGLVLGMGTGYLRFSLSTLKGPEFRQILLYSAIGFVGILLSNAFVNLVPTNLGLGITPGTSLGTVVTVEISAPEETFFRGYLTPLFADRLGLYRGNAAQAGLFAVYHTVIYGDNIAALAIVALAGFILGYVDLKTGRLSPSLVAHFVNNLFATGIL